MTLAVHKWERRDGADREAFARAALALCRAARTQPHNRSTRFYWTNQDTIAIIRDFDGNNRPNGLPPAEIAKALYALSDLARQVSSEEWVDAGFGEEHYQQRLR